MPRSAPLHFRRRPLAVALLIFLPLPFFALLCRGRTPSRFDRANQPTWERSALSHSQAASSRPFRWRKTRKTKTVASR